jgi:hypothetical protein
MIGNLAFGGSQRPDPSRHLELPLTHAKKLYAAAICLMLGLSSCAFAQTYHFGEGQSSLHSERGGAHRAPHHVRKPARHRQPQGHREKH